jgi:multidrug efflux system membrane fusion protein
MLNPYLRLLAAGASFAYMLLLAGCAPAAGAASGAPPEVSVVNVLSESLRVADEFNGRVEAIEAVDIRPRVSGYIDRIAFVEGAEVKAGDLLFVIDQRPYRDALMSAKARQESARAAARLAQSRFVRAKELIGAHAISTEEFDASEAGRDQMLADLHAAQAAVATATLDLGFTEVRAPVSGRAGRAMLTRGNLAQADQSLLTTVVSQDAMYVYFDCDENSYLRYGGQSQASHPLLHVGLVNEDNFPREGTIDFLDNRLDPASGTIRARAIVRNDDRKLTPGLFARVRFQSGAPVKSLLIDEKAVLTDQDHRYVYVIGEGDKALRRDIVIGRKVGRLRIVRSGLDANDKVIVGGVQKVYFSGMPVKPEPAVRTVKSDTAIAAAIAQ